MAINNKQHQLNQYQTTTHNAIQQQTLANEQQQVTTSNT